MLKIETFVFNMMQENCYVVSDATGQAVIIDCGAFYDSERQAVVDYIENHQLDVKHLLCTHGHFDHVFGNDTVVEHFGILPEIHADDAVLLRSLASQMMDMVGMSYTRVVPEPVHLLVDGETISFGDHELKVLYTPGHSPGGVVFYCEKEDVLFSGDTLFRMSVGRTDLYRGSWEVLVNSLQRVLAPLPADTRVYCGHGPKTTIGDEVRMNPFFRTFK